ncbi:MAG: hypothetical protein JNN21_01205 [Candidatus Accumulibacter sp.]|uniref:hypothetical protein n=1 Tax=Accumulibacter sp. TaxID=2053492 RepID=UPI001A3C7AAF|nr:hypothetical protein [Accumulibacter sp.]MBL8390476.1 hypothetical protein [Accumulibacter sp.]HRD90638.1 hypothetical protein [Accumulibacter sp.]
MTDERAPTTTSFSFHYSESEDRIALHAPTDGDETVVWLTRRMTTGLLVALATLIARSNPNALRTPEHAAEILGFEHQNALVIASGGQGVRLQASRLPKKLPLRLVEQIELTALTNGRGRIALRAGDSRLSLELPRENLHLLHDQVAGLAKHARWNLELGEPWPASPATGDSQPRVTH